MTRILLSFLFFLLTISSSMAGQIIYFKEQKTILYTGMIENIDVFNMFMIIADPKNEVENLLLEGPGGFFGAALEIGLMVREEHIKTYAVGTCQSSCAYIWLAGEEKFVNKDTEISIHAPRLIGIEKTKSLPETIGAYGWYLGVMGYDYDLVDAIYRNDLISFELFDVLDSKYRILYREFDPNEFVWALN